MQGGSINWKGLTYFSEKMKYLLIPSYLLYLHDYSSVSRLVQSHYITYAWVYFQMLSPA